jgi:hypothetical protein
MAEPQAPVTIDLRIPANWSHPRELIARLPADCRFTPESLVLADGTEVELGFLQADRQFAGIFRSSCRRPATADELAVVDGYTVNVTLSGPGGSLAAAHRMMQAAVAIIEAGGAGVFIDNSALAHGGSDWLSMTADGSSDAVSFAFVTIIRGEVELRTMGMHTLGLCDVVMKCGDLEQDESDIVEVIRYLARGDKPVGDGHVIADLDGPRFQVFAQEVADGRKDSPLYNPFGRLKLVSIRDIAESN